MYSPGKQGSSPVSQNPQNHVRQPVKRWALLPGANVSEMQPLMDALDKATQAAEVPMVVSGADQVETGGSAVEETS